MENVTDTELIRGIRRGDPVAFERLYRSHKDAVYAFACSLTGGTAEAEDLVHEAFLGLIRRSAGIVEGGSIRAYLFQSVRNRFIDRERLHASRNQPLEAASSSASPGPGPQASSISEERSVLIRTAIDALPQAQSEVVRLRLFGRLDFGTIARTVSAPLPTVRSRYRTALEKLRETLGRTLGDVGS